MDILLRRKGCKERSSSPPVAGGGGILAISQEKILSETCMGEQVIFISVELNG